jgi:diaminopropionate ammonia-lyase
MTVVRNPLRNIMRWAPPPMEPLEFHRRLPGYRATPLRDMPHLASDIGVGRLLIKDESRRLGLPAFKVLGASWAIYRALVDRLGRLPCPEASIAELADFFAPLRPLTLATASAGNHGLAVARLARLLGFRARVWVPQGTTRARIAGIVAEGADVHISAGNYDAAVGDAAAASNLPTIIISDGAWPGFEAAAQWVIDGYSTMLWEIDDQLAALDLPRPDVVIVPVGVGALAAAVARHHRRLDRPDGAVLVGVEPTGSACVVASMLAGRLVSLANTPDTAMAGLACGTPSSIAWPRVASGFDWMVSVTDREAAAAQRRLAAHGVTSGESGAATLAVLRKARSSLEIDAFPLSTQTVLLMSTEGVIDARGQASSTRAETPQDPGVERVWEPCTDATVGRRH